MTKPITIQMLKKMGGCTLQVKKFKALFGDSVIPTKDLAKEYANEFDLVWFADNYFDDNTRLEFDRKVETLRRKYSREINLLQSEQESRLCARKERLQKDIAFTFYHLWKKEE